MLVPHTIGAYVPHFDLSLFNITSFSPPKSKTLFVPVVPTHSKTNKALVKKFVCRMCEDRNNIILGGYVPE